MTFQFTGLNSSFTRHTNTHTFDKGDCTTAKSAELNSCILVNSDNLQWFIH